MNTSDATIDQQLVNAPSASASTATAESKDESATTEKKYVNLERFKREKRLAMNRECARARRSRKKLRMQTLEHRAQELTNANTRVEQANLALMAKVRQLEAELEWSTLQQQAKQQKSLNTGTGGLFSATAKDLSMSSSSFLGGGSAAASVRLQAPSGTIPLSSAPGHSGLSGFSLDDSGMGAYQDPSVTLKYMQLLQAKRSFLGAGAGADLNKSFLTGIRNQSFGGGALSLY